MPLIFAPDADPSVPGVIYAPSSYLRPTARGYANYHADAQVAGWTASLSSLRNVYAHSYGTTGRLIAGNSTSLVELGLSPIGVYTATTVTRTSGAYTAVTATSPAETADPGYWAFASFGQYLLAGNKFNSALQVQNASGSAFVDISGAPGCATLCVHKNFVIAGNVTSYGSIVGTQDMVAWSGIGNHLTWIPSASTQAGFQQLIDIPGRIICVKPIRDAVAVYKANGIWLMRNTSNSQEPFSFQLIDNRIGIAPSSPNWGFNGGTIPPPLVDIGDGKHLFVGPGGVYIFDGASVREVGVGVIAEYIRATFAGSTPMLGHDPLNKEVVFYWWGLTYNYALDKWGSFTDVAPLAVVRADQSNLYAPALIEYPSLLYVNSDNAKYYTRYGSATYTTMGGKVLIGRNDQETVLNNITPRFATSPTSGTCTATVKYRKSLGDAAQTNTNATSNWNDDEMRFDVRQAAKWHDLTLAFQSSGAPGPMEIIDIEYGLQGAGRRTVDPLRPAV